MPLPSALSPSPSRLILAHHLKPRWTVLTFAIPAVSAWDLDAQPHRSPGSGGFPCMAVFLQDTVSTKVFVSRSQQSPHLINSAGKELVGFLGVLSVFKDVNSEP